MKIYLPKAAIPWSDDVRIGAISYSPFSNDSKVPYWVMRAWSRMTHNNVLCALGFHERMDLVNLDGSVTLAVCIICKAACEPREPQFHPCAMRVAMWDNMNRMVSEVNEALDAMDRGGECIECGLFNHEHAPNCWWAKEMEV